LITGGAFSMAYKLRILEKRGERYQCARSTF
jgi:hypothetical protein